MNWCALYQKRIYWTRHTIKSAKSLYDIRVNGTFWAGKNHAENDILIHLNLNHLPIPDDQGIGQPVAPLVTPDLLMGGQTDLGGGLVMGFPAFLQDPACRVSNPDQCLPTVHVGKGCGRDSQCQRQPDNNRFQIDCVTSFCG